MGGRRRRRRRPRGVAPRRPSPLRGFNWGLAAAALARLDWPWLLLSLVMVAATYYGRALRWAVFLKPLKLPTIRNLLFRHCHRVRRRHLFGRPGELVRPI